MKVFTAAQFSDLAALAEIIKMLSDKKEVGALIGEMKLKSDALKEREASLNAKEQELERMKVSLSQTEESILSDKEKSAKALASAEKEKIEAESKMAEYSAIAGKFSQERSDFESYKEAKLAEIKAAEDKINSDLGKAKKLYDEGFALKAEFEEKLAKLKQMAG